MLVYEVVIEQNMDTPNVDSCTFRFESWSDMIEFMETCLDNATLSTRIIIQEVKEERH